MTAQANNSWVKSRVFEDQHSLWKKGAGQGIHQSDVICSTVGWLKDASRVWRMAKTMMGTGQGNCS
jgi:hypothetical protein